MEKINQKIAAEQTGEFSKDMSRVTAEMLENLFPVEDDRKFVLVKHIKNLLVSVYQVEEKFETIVKAYNQLADELQEKEDKKKDQTNDVQIRKENK